MPRGVISTQCSLVDPNEKRPSACLQSSLLSMYSQYPQCGDKNNSSTGIEFPQQEHLRSGSAPQRTHRHSSVRNAFSPHSGHRTMGGSPPSSIAMYASLLKADASTSGTYDSGDCSSPQEMHWSEMPPYESSTGLSRSPLHAGQRRSRTPFPTRGEGQFAAVTRFRHSSFSLW
jgi:hypothetical protein